MGEKFQRRPPVASREYRRSERPPQLSHPPGGWSRGTSPCGPCKGSEHHRSYWFPRDGHYDRSRTPDNGAPIRTAD